MQNASFDDAAQPNKKFVAKFHTSLVFCRQIRNTPNKFMIVAKRWRETEPVRIAASGTAPRCACDTSPNTSNPFPLDPVQKRTSVLNTRDILNDRPEDFEAFGLNPQVSQCERDPATSREKLDEPLGRNNTRFAMNVMQKTTPSSCRTPLRSWQLRAREANLTPCCYAAPGG
jgi:hypothetical protein